MKIPCMERLPFIICGLSFLRSELSGAQFSNLTLIATALILGSKFNLTEISRMWLKERCVSTLSWFMSDAKFSTSEMQHLYALHVLHLYKIRKGYFLIDDTMRHHTKFCKWIHGVAVLFDHAVGTNLKAVCIVFLYYTDGDIAKCPLDFRIFYKNSRTMKWLRGRKYIHKKKYELATGMLEKALERGFPGCMVLADSWFGIEPFVKELRRLKLGYVLEIKDSHTVRQPCGTPKLTPTGRLAKKQYNLLRLREFFRTVLPFKECGFAADREKEEKVLYRTKVATVRLNAISGKNRIVESIDIKTQKSKYLLSDRLTWESAKILSSYNHRWVIEEFFRNAKQLSDMEGATVRSKQGVTLALCLVSWIDFLFHLENCKLRIAGKLTGESLTIPSIVRQAQCDNLERFIEKIQQDQSFVQKWLEIEKEHIERSRKKNYKLIELDEADSEQLDMAA